MGVAQKHAYRFGFLKSEKWRNLRLEVLARKDARCFLCGVRDLSNDIHHVWYPPNIWETTSRDLVVLCRCCHTTVHSIVETSKSRVESFIRFRVATTELIGKNLFRKRLKKNPALDEATKPDTEPEHSSRIQEETPHQRKWKDPKCAGCRSKDVELKTFHIARNRRIDEAPHHYWRLCGDCIQSLQSAMSGWSDDPHYLFSDIRKWKKTRER